MKPFLPKEITLHAAYLGKVPIDLPRAIMLLFAVWMLKDSPFPIKLSVNMFRALVNADPHPDDRGLADLLDPDEEREGDNAPTKDELIAAKAELEKNNQGKLQRGELQKDFAQLYDATK